jgi:hypothetical protein
VSQALKAQTAYREQPVHKEFKAQQVHKEFKEELEHQAPQAYRVYRVCKELSVLRAL